MNERDRVAVCSRSFSRNTILRGELLARYRRVTFNDDGLKLEGQGLIDFLDGHDKAIVALERIDAQVLDALPDLKAISKYGVGLDGIDVGAVQTRGIQLGWKGGVNRRSVSELTLSCAIALLRHVPAAHREVLGGTWRQHTGYQLSGKTVGIIGCGFVGKDLVRLLQPFDCRILVNDIRTYPEFFSKYAIERVGLEQLLEASDVVTLHVPLDDSTRNILSADRLALLRSTSILINAARGGLVDESALKTMLKEKRLMAAAFDVFAVEPPEDRELIDLPNFLVSPHIGGSAHEAILAMGRAAIDGLD